MTDANVVLGYIPTGPLATGDLTVSRELAEEAVGALGAPLGLSTLEAARGIHDLANASMMRALRAVSTEKGRDPRDFALVAYGGSGPGARGGARGRARRPHGDRAAARRPLLRGRAAVRAHRVPRRALLPRRARASPTSTRCGGSTPRCASSSRRGSATASPSGARRRRPLPRPELEHAIELPRRARREPHRAALVERFEAEHERLYGTRLEPGLAGRHPRAPARRARARRASGVRAAAPRGREPRGRARASPTSAPAHGALEAPVVSRAVARRRAGRRARCSSTSTTRRSSSRPAGRCGSIRGAQRSCSTCVAAGRPRDERRTPTRSRSEIVANALATVADEMATTIFRTAHSTVVRDAMDFSAALCDPTGETVAQAVTIPLQLGSIPNAMRTLLERFGERASAPATSSSSTTRSTAPATRPTSSSSKPSFARRDADRLRGHGRAPRRRRRAGAGHERVRQHRGLPGGPAPAVDAALRGGRAATRRCST